MKGELKTKTGRNSFVAADIETFTKANCGAQNSARLFVTANERGWMTGHLFASHIRRLSEMSGNQHAWVIFDSFRGHVTEEVARVFRACANLTPIVLPPHSTPLLQVHDTHVNAAFKAAYRTRRNARETPHTRLSFLESVTECIAEVPRCSQMALRRTFCV